MSLKTVRQVKRYLTHWQTVEAQCTSLCEASDYATHNALPIYQVVTICRFTSRTKRSSVPRCTDVFFVFFQLSLSDFSSTVFGYIIVGRISVHMDRKYVILHKKIKSKIQLRSKTEKRKKYPPPNPPEALKTDEGTLKRMTDNKFSKPSHQTSKGNVFTHSIEGSTSPKTFFVLILPFWFLYSVYLLQGDRLHHVFISVGWLPRFMGCFLKITCIKCNLLWCFKSRKTPQYKLYTLFLDRHFPTFFFFLDILSLCKTISPGL